MDLLTPKDHCHNLSICKLVQCICPQIFTLISNQEKDSQTVGITKNYTIKQFLQNLFNMMISQWMVLQSEHHFENCICTKSTLCIQRSLETLLITSVAKYFVKDNRKRKISSFPVIPHAENMVSYIFLITNLRLFIISMYSKLDVCSEGLLRVPGTNLVYHWSQNLLKQ